MRPSELDGAWVPVAARDAAGNVMRLRDFGTAGADRRPYVTWLRARNAAVGAFSRENPLRTTSLARRE